MLIRKIEREDYEGALNLVWNTFMQYEAPDYSAEGIDTFRSSVIDNEDYLNRIHLYGAFEESELLGVIATRNGGNHIALFFVDGLHHRQGIGRKLFNVVLENSTSNEITVNSSPYAVAVYRRLGFVDTEAEKTTDGMRYVPMIYRKGAG
ncbi:MAG: GNAT family N-acetyltransferase [Candidatus Pelethousia sp.]|nr:GNAT family N-acetyltransferase [Candidatus Pelethousia sp.]